MQCPRLMAYCAALGNAPQQTEIKYFFLFGSHLECSHQFWVFSDEKMMTNWRRMGEGPLRWLQSHDIMKSLREEHLFSLSLSRLRRESNAIFSYLMGD